MDAACYEKSRRLSHDSWDLRCAPISRMKKLPIVSRNNWLVAAFLIAIAWYVGGPMLASLAPAAPDASMGRTIPVRLKGTHDEANYVTQTEYDVWVWGLYCFGGAVLAAVIIDRIVASKSP
jgi:hypothetical protein